MEYYETADGQCDIAEFLDGLKQSQRDKVLAWITQLEKEGPTLPRPYADVLKDGIHELRVKVSRDHVRVLYFFCFETRIVLSHAFTKRQSRVPPGEITKAINRRNDYVSRNG